MMARFIDTIVACQKGCRESGEYDRFPDRQKIRELFLIQQEDMLMDLEVSTRPCRLSVTTCDIHARISDATLPHTIARPRL